MKTVFFDLETGGLRNDQPNIQLAAIAVDDETGQELAAIDLKLQFDEKTADAEALKLNHYDREIWQREAITLPEAAQKFAMFLKPFCCLQMVSKRTGQPYSVAKLNGYNAATFDGPRLKAMFAQQFLAADPRIRCTLQRTLWWFDEHGIELPNYQLQTVCEYFGIPIRETHNPLADVRATAALARRLKDSALPVRSQTA